MSKRKISQYLFHKPGVVNRLSIKKYGIIPQVGPSYCCHWNFKKGLKPLIFLYDKSVCEYDSTFDDDIYQIDTSKLDKRKIASDPDKSMNGCYVYSAQISDKCYEIVYKGTGKV